jgi:hypothetical protein
MRFAPSLARKLFIEAQAATCVPSTEKCSSDRRLRTSLWFSNSARNLRATSAWSSRSRFFVNTVGTHTTSSTPSPPAIKKIVVELLHPSAASPTGSCRTPAAAALAAAAWPPARRVDLRKLNIQRDQHVVDDAPDHTEWMLGPNPVRGLFQRPAKSVTRRLVSFRFCLNFES